MAYVKKIIGNDERIIGIARLHWIYLAKGLFAFTVCMSIGLIFNAVLFKVLGALSDLAPTTTERIALGADTWIMPFAIIVGGLYFMFYLLMVLYTEIALTEKRIIYKRGFMFVKIQEIDIEEISGENMDMGYFGSILGYGYIMLDCRFVGDVTLPAVSKANTFIKALHAARTNVVPMYPDAAQVAQALVTEMPAAAVTSNEKPEHEMIKPLEPKPIEELNEDGELVMADGKPKDDEPAEADKKVEVIAAQREQEKEILQLEIAKLELEVKLKEIEVSESEPEETPDKTEGKPDNATQQRMAPATPPTIPTPPAVAAAEATTAPSIAPVDVAAAVQTAPAIAKMPQITDSIAEELIAKGLIPHPDEIKPEPEFIEEPLSAREPPESERLEPTKIADPLQHSFGSAAFVFKSTEDGVLKPAAPTI